MRVTVTGATGRIGTRLVGALRKRGDDVTVLSRNPDKARASLQVEAHAWQPESEPAPAAALAGRDGVVHLAGEDVAQRWSGAVNATAPTPATNKEFSGALGRALHRPALAPVPSFAIRALYGEMAQIVITGHRAVPERTQALGFSFAHSELDEALRSALAG